MARSKGSANFAGSLEVLAGAPLDARTVVNVKADLTDSQSYTYVYVGMIVSVKSEGKAYILTAADFTDSNNWSELGSGGSGTGGVVEGYFNPTDDLFYEESTYETAITGESGMLYVSLDTNRLYRFNGTIFVVVSDLDATVYQPAGSVLFANLPAASAGTLGFVYDIQDDFVTTSDFIEGAGKAYSAGTNVVVINHGTSSLPIYKYDVLSGVSGSYTAGDGIDITNNEISVKVDGDSITIDEYGVLHASGGGGGVKLTDVTGANVSMNRKVASITWTDPPDVTISGATLAEWDGTKVLVKQGSAPANTTDGTVVINETGIRSQYASTPLTYSNLEYDTMYYFRFFPYTTEGAETRGTAISVTPVRDVIPYVPSTSSVLTYDGTAQSPTWQNYDSTKMTMSGDTEGTNAGSYTTVFTPLPDYKWDDGTTEAKSVTWSIGKADADCTFSQNPVELTMSKLTDTSVISNETGTILGITNSDSSIVTASLNDHTISLEALANGNVTITVNIDSDSNYNAGTKTLSVVSVIHPSLDETSWADISTISASGQASSYWSIGDKKSIRLNGTIGTLNVQNYDIGVFIIGFDHNSSIEGSGISFCCFEETIENGRKITLVDSNYNQGKNDGTKIFNMNHWGGTSSPYSTNYGGWKGCDMRYDILGSTDAPPSGYGSVCSTNRTGYDASITTATSPVANTLMAALPSDLRAVMKPITKYTDNVGNKQKLSESVTSSVDYLPLLAVYEALASNRETNPTEETYQEQYSYFANGNIMSFYKFGSTGTAWGDTARCLFRSPNSTSVYIFNAVDGSGNITLNVGSSYSYGIVPIFLV